MESIQKYYENTMDALPHPIVEEFVNMNITPQNAIDLGCGAGRDTIYLIKLNFLIFCLQIYRKRYCNLRAFLRLTFNCPICIM